MDMKMQEQNGNSPFDIASKTSDTTQIYLVDELNIIKMDACFTAFDKDG